VPGPPWYPVCLASRFVLHSEQMKVTRDSSHLIGGAAVVALMLAAVLIFLSLRPIAPSPGEEIALQNPPGGAGHLTVGQRGAQPPLTPGGTPTPAYPGVYDATPTPNPTPTGRPDPTRSQVYEVQTGDTLSGIAYAFDCTVDEIAAANGLTGDAIWPGQRLTIPVGASQFGPAVKLLPDSELVYGPAYIHFDLEGFVAAQSGYLAGYTQEVEGHTLTGAEIVRLVAQRYSVGPRVLLALLELRAGWVTDPDPPADTLEHPVTVNPGTQAGLFEQLSWTAAELNSGYYGWKYGDWTVIHLADGSRMGISPGLNAGTVAVQSLLGQLFYGAEWTAAVGPDGFAATYQRLFGNPFAYGVEPLLPPGLTQPELRLPWPEGETWYLTGGPHGGWGRGSGWAALDFAPADELGCTVTADWVTAAAPGLVLRSDYGEVVVDLDGDGYEQSGWVLTYMHIAAQDRVEASTWLEQGQAIGHPSCEGGYADATHLHFARRYNGEWLPAGSGPLPLVLSGWTAEQADQEYDGRMVRGGQVREACQCAVDEINGLLSDNTPR